MSAFAAKLGRRGGQRVVGIGGREVTTLGATRNFWADLYHNAMTVSWAGFVAVSAGLFVASNLAFAAVLALGQNPVADAHGFAVGQESAEEFSRHRRRSWRWCVRL